METSELPQTPGPTGEIIKYLIESYERTTQEERYASKRGATIDRKSTLAGSKEACVSYCALVLAGYFDSLSDSDSER